MLEAQVPLPLPRPMRVKARSVRRHFHPSPCDGPYRLPREAQERLASALAPYRNREAAYTLAVFLGRFWSTPSRIIDAFPIDRRELADRPDLGLTEDRVRGAIRTLEAIGFLDRVVASGSKYKATEDGLRRKPILFRFGSDYAPSFIKANRRATAARGARFGERRPLPTENTRRPSAVNFQASPLKSPKSKSEAESSVLMGEVKKSGIPPKAFEPNPNLEAALDRLLQGIRHSRGSGEDRAK